jgi:hypothetical protein
MGFDNVRYAKKFPLTFSLDNPVEIDLENKDIIGMLNFRIFDSIIIFSTKYYGGFWAIASLPDHQLLGKYFNQGQGPYEFTGSPSISGRTSFFKKNNELFAAIYDYYKGKIYKMNISKSIRDQQLSINTLFDSTPGFLSGVVFIDSLTILCRKRNETETHIKRFLLNDGIIPSHLEKLNQAHVRQGEDFNILAAGMVYCPDKKLVVEMPLNLNYINIYALDGSSQQTICVGDELDDIEKIQNTDRLDRIYKFGSLRLFPDFWGVLHLNESLRAYTTIREQLPEILLFDWEGKPLAQLKLNRFVSTFDIDFAHGFLYTLDDRTEKFYKYDIRDVLGKLK